MHFIYQLFYWVGFTSGSLWFEIEPSSTFFHYDYVNLYCKGISTLNEKIYYKWFCNQIIPWRPISFQQNITVTLKQKGTYYCLIQDEFGSLLSHGASVKSDGFSYPKSRDVIYNIEPGNAAFLTSPDISSSSISSFVWKREISHSVTPVEPFYYTLNKSLLIPLASIFGKNQVYKCYFLWKGEEYLVKTYTVTTDGRTDNSCTGGISYFYKPKKTINLFKGDILRIEVLAVVPGCSTILQYKWYKENNQVSSNRTLVIHDIDDTHKGEYELRVFNTVTYIETFKVIVHERPTLPYITVGSVVKHTNEDIYLHAPPIDNEANVKLFTKWIVDGDPLIKNTSVYTHFQNGTLLIRNVNPSHSGYYEVIYTYHGFPSYMKGDSKGGYLKEVIVLDVQPSRSGCGGKMISSSGLIRYFHNMSLSTSSSPLSCSWMVSIPTSQQTVIEFIKVPFSTTSLQQNANSERDNRCQDTQVNILLGNRFRRKKRFSYCVTNPTKTHLLLNESIFFVTAELEPAIWKSNALLLSFYPRSRVKPTPSEVTNHLATSLVASTKPRNSIHVTPSQSIKSSISPSRSIESLISQSQGIKSLISLPTITTTIGSQQSSTPTFPVISKRNLITSTTHIYQPSSRECSLSTTNSNSNTDQQSTQKSTLIQQSELVGKSSEKILISVTKGYVSKSSIQTTLSMEILPTPSSSATKSITLIVTSSISFTPLISKATTQPKTTDASPIEAKSTGALYAIIGASIAVVSIVLIVLSYCFRSKLSFKKSKKTFSLVIENEDFDGFERTISKESQANLVSNEQIQARLSSNNVKTDIGKDNSKPNGYEMCQLKNGNLQRKSVAFSENHYAVAESQTSLEKQKDSEDIKNDNAIYNRISVSSDVYSNRSSSSHDYKVLEPEYPRVSRCEISDKSEYAGLLPNYSHADQYACLNNQKNAASNRKSGNQDETLNGTNDLQYAHLDSHSPPKYASLKKDYIGNNSTGLTCSEVVGNHSTGLAHSDDYVFM